MSTTVKVLRTMVVVGIVAGIAALGVFSAFSSQTDNPGNVVTAGTVALADNDGGTALYSLPTAKPGDAKTSCIRVTYTGSLDASVRMYTPSAIGALGPQVNLKIEPGTQTTPSFPSCTGFTAVGAALYDGPLSTFGTTYASFATGLATNPPAATKWVANDAIVYRVTATLSATAPDTAQGQSTGSHTLRWEAQNQ